MTSKARPPMRPRPPLAALRPSAKPHAAAKKTCAGAARSARATSSRGTLPLLKKSSVLCAEMNPTASAEAKSTPSAGEAKRGERRAGTMARTLRPCSIGAATKNA